MWAGPPVWVFAPGGWKIERRPHRPTRSEDSCEGFDKAKVATLRIERESRLSFGVVTLRDGEWLEPVVGAGRGKVPACEIVRLELGQPRSSIRVEVTAAAAFALAMRDGKVVDTAGPSRSGSAVFTLEGDRVDTVAVYARKLASISFCISKSKGEGNREWSDATTLVDGLNLPIRELMPELVDEYGEAKSRLLDFEEIDEAAFARAADLFRTTFAACGPARPIDITLLCREQPSEPTFEAAALDPLCVLATDPTWRRAFGLGWFDRDPALVEGARYDYRITGRFPAEDLADRVYGLHMLPSETTLPAEFYFGDLRVRLAEPGRVEHVGELADDRVVGASRRGIRLGPRDRSWWREVSTDEWSVVFDFPTPVAGVTLELADGHDLTYTAGEAAGTLNDEQPVPSGPSARLEFPEPADHLRLRGKGLLFAVRVPHGRTGMRPVSTVVSGVRLENTARPAAPLLTAASSLQKPNADAAPDGVSHRHELGLELTWRPAIRGGLEAWPAGADAAPPLDATWFEVEHRRVKVGPSGEVLQAKPWQPVLEGTNRMFGSRDTSLPEKRIHPGVDFESRFPEARRKNAAGLDMSWRDVFDPAAGGSEVRDAMPRAGSFHQYRVWSVDSIGRRSETARESGAVRLEKHVPPPVPVGPVRARVLVRDSPELNDADLAVLGDSHNAIVLEWGWLAEQRKQDPYASEFRIYASDGPLDRVPGQVVGVTETGDGLYDVDIHLARPVVADEARGLTLNAGYPFRVAASTAGSTIVATIRALVTSRDGRFPVPALGPISFPTRTSSKFGRPEAWPDRVAVVAVSEADEYTFVLRDRLTLAPESPRAAIWVGVSAADREAYVADQFPGGGRSGNESAIVAVTAEAIYRGRPEFAVPLLLSEVPEFVAAEPTRGTSIVLDLEPYLGAAGFPSGSLVRPERVSADSLYCAYEATPDDRIIARVFGDQSGSDEPFEVTLPTASDRDAVLEALRARSCQAIGDAYLVYLASAHPNRDRLFEPLVTDPIPLGAFEHAALPGPGRYLYRFRLADAAGNVSADGFVARVVVRSPSPVPPAAPERLAREAGDGASTLRLRTAPEREAPLVLVFRSPATAAPPAVELVRVMNRPDLQAADRVRLRSADGALLVPTAAVPDDAGIVVVEAGGAPGERVRLWACAVSRDGVPSSIAGPWTVAMPPPALAAPVLTVTTDGDDRIFDWSWTQEAAAGTALERSSDGETWTRISPLFDERTTSFRHRPASGIWQYRLEASCPDGRRAHSNVVV